MLDESEDEEEIQKEIPKSDLDRLDALRSELKTDRKMYAFRVGAIFFFQISLSLLILIEADRDGSFDLDTWVIPSLKIGFTRLIAGIIMHVIVSGEISAGLRMMKYAANHWWKFSNPRLAWLTGFLQVVAMFNIALINYFVVTISDNVLDVAKDFTALLIISDFDDILADQEAPYQKKSEPAIESIEYDGLLKIETTTSKDAKSTANKKLAKDPTFEKINRRRALASGGI